MKKLFTLALIAVCALGAAAQYVAAPGTVLEYSMKMQNPETHDSISINAVSKIISATPGDDGKVTYLCEETATSPEKALSNTDTTTVVYNPADHTTFFMMMDKDKTRQEVIKSIKEMIAQSGQFVSESDLADMERSITAKGELSLTLADEMAEGTKLPNKSLRINVAEKSFSHNLWEGKVLGRESVDTPAGTFDCLKISYVHKVSTPEGNERIYVTGWYAPNVGEVKEIQATKKGETISETILTALTKPE